MSKVIELLIYHPFTPFAAIFAIACLFVIIIVSIKDRCILPGLAFIFLFSMALALETMNIECRAIVYYIIVFLVVTVIVLNSYHQKFRPLLELNPSHFFLLLWFLIMLIGIFLYNPAPRELVVKKIFYCISFVFCPYYLGRSFSGDLKEKKIERIFYYIMIFMGVCSILLFLASVMAYQGEERLGFDNDTSPTLAISKISALTLLVFLFNAFFLKQKSFNIVISLIVVVLSLFTLLLTVSRGAVFSASVAFFIILFFFRQLTMKRFLFSAMTMIFVVGIAVVTLPDETKDSLNRRFDASDVTLEEYSNNRLYLYRIAFQMIYERPVLGFGPASFSVFAPWGASSDKAAKKFDANVSLYTPHNAFLEAFCENGLLGLLCFLGVLFFSTLQLLNLRHSEHYSNRVKYMLACFFITHLFLMQGVANMTNLPLLWLMIGLLTQMNEPSIGFRRKRFRFPDQG